MNTSSSDDNLLKVIRIDVLTATPNVSATDGHEINKNLPEIPLLSFELENGENFLMSSIPLHIAVEIARNLSGVKSADSRLSISEIVPELCIIEKIVIDAIVPFSNAYQASVEIILEGVSEVQHFQMIPSHAVLLGLISNSSIFVAESLVSSTDEIEPEE